MDIQLAALKKVPAFKDLVVYRPGYAIEYDYFDPTQLKHTLESKIIKFPKNIETITSIIGNISNALQLTRWFG